MKLVMVVCFKRATSLTDLLEPIVPKGAVWTIWEAGDVVGS